MFVADRDRGHDIENRHATLLAMAVQEATLSDEMLLFVGQQDVIGAVVRAEHRFAFAVLELTDFEGSSEAEMVAKDEVRNFEILKALRSFEFCIS